VDAAVIADAHRRALIAGRSGERYAIVGFYLSYTELARTVAEVAGRPWKVLVMPDSLEAPFKCLANLIERMRLTKEISATTVAGGYLRLYVSGRKADECFRLVHPPPIESIRAVLRGGDQRSFESLDIPLNP
jgi:dihydroflavonol-4-reductase